MERDMCENIGFFLLGMLVVLSVLVAVIFSKEDPWERAKWNLIHRIHGRVDPNCRCDDVDKMIADEMNRIV